MDLATFDWLRSTEGAALLDVAAEAYADADGDPVAAAEQVRRRAPAASADQRAAALSQVTLRVRAVAKLGPDAIEMWFTADALEQATRRRVADHRAGRLAAAQPGGSVLDLGCGVGGDLLAFSRAGLIAAGLELDPLRAAMAAANLVALGLPGAVQQGDATTVDLAPFDAVFADPARRGARGRVFDVQQWTPPWPWVLELLGAVPVPVPVPPGRPW